MSILFFKLTDRKENVAIIKRNFLRVGNRENNIGKKILIDVDIAMQKAASEYSEVEKQQRIV